MSNIGLKNVKISSDGFNFTPLSDTGEFTFDVEQEENKLFYPARDKLNDLSIDINIENNDLLNELNKISPEDNIISLGVDLGNGDIHNIGRFEIEYPKIILFKRKRKGKRYIIYKYESNRYYEFKGVANGKVLSN